MPAVRLPQSIQEINAAAKQIVDTAYPDLTASGSTKLFKDYEADQKLVAGWLATIAALGALSHPDLVTQAAHCLSQSSSQLHALMPGRIALILNRRTWVKASS